MPIVARWGCSPPPGDDVFVLAVPGSAAPLHAFDLPAGVSDSTLRRIAARQLADRLGPMWDNPVLLPLPRPKRAESGSSRAIVVSKDQCADWCSSDLATDARCMAVLPDYLTLPAAPDLVVIQGTATSIRVRIGIEDGFTAPPHLAPFLLQNALESHPSRSVQIDGELPRECRDVLQQAGLDAIAPDSAPAQAFAHGELRLDLRRSGSEEDEALAMVRLWSVAAAIGLAAFGLWAFGLAAEANRANRAAAQARSETTAILRRGLLPDGPILDIRRQVTKRLDGNRANNSGPLEPSTVVLLNRVAHLLYDNDAQIHSIEREPDGTLAVDAVLDDFDAIDLLVSDMESQGLAARSRTARALDDGRVEARLRIHANTGGQP
ncbi:MAG: type II secretion system protein GspL [Marinibacterium sp.]